MIDVVTVWAPRKQNPKWRDDYMQLLALQRQSVRRVRHRHVTVTDDPKLTEAKGCIIIRKTMRESLMFAILEGQIAYVEQYDNKHPFVLADIDCIVVRDLAPLFAGAFKVMLTVRGNPVSPIQNGAMYFNVGCKDAALRFLRRALELCKDHWGGDQEAISQAVAPVPPIWCISSRFDAPFSFVGCDHLNHSNSGAVPKVKNRYMMHFKGESKKFAAEFAQNLFRGSHGIT